MEIYNLFPGSFASNCYLLVSKGQAAVVDPSADAASIQQALMDHGAVLKYIFLTHGHFDHICSLDDLRDRTLATAYVHQADADMPCDAYKNAFYTFFHQERVYRRPENVFCDGDTFPLGGESICVIHTPGHTEGSVCYDCNGEFLLTGDTLFAEGYGRCDLYGGSIDRMRASLKLLRTLPQNMRIYPGHGAPEVLGTALDMSAFFY